MTKWHKGGGEGKWRRDSKQERGWWRRGRGYRNEDIRYGGQRGQDTDEKVE